MIFGTYDQHKAASSKMPIFLSHVSTLMCDIDIANLSVCLSVRDVPVLDENSSVIKSCVTVFTDLIARLANLSFSQGVFSSKYKFAIVTPLL